MAPKRGGRGKNRGGGGGDRGGSSSRGGRGGGGVGNKADQTPAARIPIDDPNLGEIEELKPDMRTEDPPEVKKYGVYSPSTPHETPQSNKMMIFSNYVKVKKIPDTLHVYSLKFTRPGKEDSRFDYNKQREIQDAYDAMIKANALGLDGKDLKWVTDFKSLWCTEPMNGHAPVIGTVFQSDDFEYIQPNGRKVPKLRADVTYTASLTDIEAKLRKNDLADLPEYIRALNANVAQCVVQHASNTGKQVSRVGANRFFLDKGYIEMHGGLRAARGYFTSIRPGTEGTLLNINAATSAFLPPVTVADFARGVSNKNIKNLDYVSQLLHGATVKILYRRQCYENGVDYNSTQAQPLS
jgi:eukaryotic translation initiation factor 2C